MANWIIYSINLVTRPIWGKKKTFDLRHHLALNLVHYMSRVNDDNDRKQLLIMFVVFFTSNPFYHEDILIPEPLADVGSSYLRVLTFSVHEHFLNHRLHQLII